MKAPKYYGMYGTNGFMIANKWYRIDAARQFCFSEQFKSFETIDDAICYAVHGYNSLNPDCPYYGLVERMNWFYNKKTFSHTNPEDPIQMVTFKCN
jgi:hypothetical protein